MIFKEFVIIFISTVCISILGYIIYGYINDNYLVHNIKNHIPFSSNDL
jgi:hypothetical protein